MKHRVALGFALGLALLLATGCREAGTSPTLKVTGTVTYNGKPMEGVNVTFTPGGGRPGTGTTDASGRFTVSTFQAGDGAVPGHHVVTMSPGGPTPMPMPTGEEGGGEEETVAWPFPKRYGDPEASGFTADVERGKSNDFPFNMTD